MNKLAPILTAMFFAAGAASAETLYFQGTGAAAIGWTSTSFWTTDAAGTTPPDPAKYPGANDVYAIGDKASASLVNMGSSNISIAGVLNNYSGTTATTSNNYFSGTLLSMGYITQNSSNYALIFRRTNGNTNMTLSVTDRIDVTAGTLMIGNTSGVGGTGQSVQNFKVGTFTTVGDVTTATGNGVSVGGTSTSKLSVAADSVQMASLSVAANGTAEFFHIGPASGGSWVATKASDVTVYNAFSVNGGGTLSFGRATLTDGGAALNSVKVLSAASISGSGSKLATYAETVDMQDVAVSDRASAAFYKADKYSYTSGSGTPSAITSVANVTMKSFTLSNGANANFGTSASALDTLTIANSFSLTNGEGSGVATNAYIYASKTDIGSISFFNNSYTDAGQGYTAYGNNLTYNSADSKVGSLTFGKASAAAADLTKTNSTLILGSNMTVTGDVVVGVSAATTTASGTINGGGKTFSAAGELKMHRGAGLTSVLFLDSSSAGNSTFSFAGINGYNINGTTMDDQARIYSQGANRNTLILSGTTAGNKLYRYSGRIHDFSGSTAFASAANWWNNGVGALSLTKNGGDTQYLTGYTYIKGTTTVNAGKLFVGNVNMGNGKAGNTVQINGYDGYGLSALVLNGGGFGACAYTDVVAGGSEIGIARVASLEWNGGKILVDVSGTSCDLIQITGELDTSNSTGFSILAGTATLTKGDAAGSVFMFEFSGIFEEDFEYKVMEWSEDCADFDFSEFTANSDRWTFRMDDTGLYATYTVPEPAEYAALFGLCALLFAIRRRRTL